MSTLTRASPGQKMWGHAWPMRSTSL